MPRELYDVVHSVNDAQPGTAGSPAGKPAFVRALVRAAGRSPLDSGLAGRTAGGTWLCDSVLVNDSIVYLHTQSRPLRDSHIPILQAQGLFHQHAA